MILTLLSLVQKVSSFCVINQVNQALFSNAQEGKGGKSIRPMFVVMEQFQLTEPKIQEIQLLYLNFHPLF